MTIFPYLDYCRVSGRSPCLCSIARSARCDVRWVAALFVGSDGTEKRVPSSPPADRRREHRCIRLLAPLVCARLRQFSSHAQHTAVQAWNPYAVPRFEPFAAIRYATDDLASVIAPPYDVLSDADVDALEARSIHNVCASTYRGVARTATTLRRRRCVPGSMRDSLSPTRNPRSPSTACVSPTRLARGATSLGCSAALEVVDLEAGGVLPHERTTAEASTDRLDLTRATGANLSPVWGLSLSAGLTELLAEPGEALGAVTDAGVEHVRGTRHRSAADRRHSRQAGRR